MLQGAQYKEHSVDHGIGINKVQCSVSRTTVLAYLKDEASLEGDLTGWYRAGTVVAETTTCAHCHRCQEVQDRDKDADICSQLRPLRALLVKSMPGPGHCKTARADQARHELPLHPRTCHILAMLPAVPTPVVSPIEIS